MVQHHRFTCFQRRRHAGRVLGFHAIDLHVRSYLFHVGRDAGQQPATAAAAKYRIQPPPVPLPENLRADAALSRNNERIVEGVDERQTLLIY